MKRLVALTAITVLTAAAPAWASVIELDAAPGVTALTPAAPVPAAPSNDPVNDPVKPKHAQNASASLSKEEIIRRQCAVARYQHDQLYKAGVPDADEQVNVRAACEPDEVAAESTAKWVFAGVLLVGACFMFPLLLMGMAPG